VAILYTNSPDVNLFDLSAKYGLERAKEVYGIEWEGFEWVTAEERERIMRNLADQGFNLIINTDSATWVQTEAAAAAFPDVWFGLTYGAPYGEMLPPNTFGIDPSTLDGAYLGGILGGGMTNSNKIGYPVGFIFPFMTATFEAFKMGAKSVNPDVEVFVVETFTWTDAVKGKEVGNALIDQGCDILVHLTGAVDVGVVQAARENDLVTIASAAAADSVGFYERNLATFTYRVDKAIFDVVGLFVGGRLENIIYTGGLMDKGWSDLSPFEHPEWIPDEVVGQIFKARSDILSGELEIPFIPEPTPP
jgi:basic membrane protein A